jgi:hypothetical protein
MRSRMLAAAAMMALASAGATVRAEEDDSEVVVTGDPNRGRFTINLTDDDEHRDRLDIFGGDEIVYPRPPMAREEAAAPREPTAFDHERTRRAEQKRARKAARAKDQSNDR